MATAERRRDRGWVPYAVMVLSQCTSLGVFCDSTALKGRFQTLLAGVAIWRHTGLAASCRLYAAQRGNVRNRVVTGLSAFGVNRPESRLS